MNIPFVSKRCQEKFPVGALSPIKICTYRAVAALRQEEAASHCSRTATLQSNIDRRVCIARAVLVQASKKQPDRWFDSLNEMFLNVLHQQTPLPFLDLWGVF